LVVTALDAGEKEMAPFTALLVDFPSDPMALITLSMVGRALSDRVKRQKLRRHENTKLQNDLEGSEQILIYKAFSVASHACRDTAPTSLQ
jgi:hypothetical protein